jgi:hypothetical protein
MIPTEGGAGNNPMHPSGEVGRFEIDNFSSPPGDWWRYRADVPAESDIALPFR